MNGPFPDEPTDGEGHDPIEDRLRSTFQSQYRAEQARVGNGLVEPRPGVAGRRGDVRPSNGRSSGSTESTPSGRWLLAAAAAMVLVATGVGIARWGGDDPVQRMEAVDESDDGSPSSTTSSVQQAPAETAEPTTTSTPDADATSVDDGATDPDPDRTDVDPTAGYTRATGHAVVQLEGGGQTSFAAFDVVAGEVTEIFWSEYTEATGFGSLELAPSGLALYMTQGFEDSWYSCESSLPFIMRLDLGPGVDRGERMVEVARGLEPQVSPDGTRLAYLTASDCVPDPQNPGNWVVTPIDTVVVRELATGDEQRRTVPGLVDAITSGADDRGLDLRGLAWLSDERLGVSGGEMLSADDLNPTGDQLPALVEPDSSATIIGYMRSDRLFLVGVPDPENPWAMIGFDSIDVDTGDRQQGWRPPDDEEARPPGDLSDMVFAIDTLGRHIYVASRDFPENRLDLPDGTTYEGELRLQGLGW